jgi:hypothetical protein
LAISVKLIRDIEINEDIYHFYLFYLFYLEIDESILFFNSAILDLKIK